MLAEQYLCLKGLTVRFTFYGSGSHICDENTGSNTLEGSGAINTGRRNMHYTM